MDQWNVSKERRKTINILQGNLKEIGEWVGQNAWKESLNKSNIQRNLKAIEDLLGQNT